MPISLRPATFRDKDFLWSLHRDTLREYVEKTWEWDEPWQHDRFCDLFDPNDRQIVEADGRPIGVLQVVRSGDVIFLKNIQILPSHQRLGAGTELVRTLIDEADERGVPIRLQVLKVNPAREFYERLSFCEVGLTETHILMEREPGE